MIEDRTCYFLLCDECPQDEPEEGPHDSRNWAERQAKHEGWLIEGGQHICPPCQTRRKYAACAADGGHHMQLKGRFKDGAESWECTNCRYWTVAEQPTLTGGAA